jgi:hypothetical protein
MEITGQKPGPEKSVMCSSPEENYFRSSANMHDYKNGIKNKIICFRGEDTGGKVANAKIVLSSSPIEYFGL